MNENPDFHTLRLPTEPDVLAPDGSAVRILLGLEAGGMAHFELPPGQTSLAVTHRTVEEIWYFVSGRGEMWRMQNGREEVVTVEPGVCLTIPLGTHFQFRSLGPQPLGAVGITMPPWPGEHEAVAVPGPWEPQLAGSTGASAPAALTEPGAARENPEGEEPLPPAASAAGGAG